MGSRMPPTSRSPRLQLWLGLFLLSMFVPPLLMSVAWIWPGAVTVIQTGTCPPAPPDIPAYPCSLGEYLARMTWGAWALMAHLITWMAWVVVNFILWGVGLLAIALYRHVRSAESGN
jgi:hypothetical protein